MAVADVFDALTQSRPYKPAWSITDAIAEIDEPGGTPFRPAGPGGLSQRPCRGPARERADRGRGRPSRRLIRAPTPRGSPPCAVALHDAVAAGQLGAVGQRAGEGPERLAVVAGDEQQVVAAHALGLGAEAQVADRVEALGEGDGADLARRRRRSTPCARCGAARRARRRRGSTPPPRRSSRCRRPALHSHAVRRAW